MTFSCIVGWSLYASLCGLVILAVKRLFQEYLSARWHLHIWTLFYIAVFLPPMVIRKLIFFRGGGILDVWDPLQTVEKAALAVELQYVQTAAGNSGVTGAATSLGLPQFISGIAPYQYPWQSALIWCWAAGAAAMALWYVTAGIRTGCVVRRGQLAGSEVTSCLEKAKQKLGMNKRQTIHVRFSDLNESPFVLGLFRPVLVLPEKYVDEEVDEGILLHELLHIEHMHIALNYLLILIRCLHFFNPLMWLLCRQIQNDCELRCDEHYMKLQQPGSDEAYTQLLLTNAVAKRSFLAGTSCLSNGQKNILLRVRRIRSFLSLSDASAATAWVLSCALIFFCFAAPSAAASVKELPNGFGFSTEVFDYNVAVAETYRLSSPLETAYAYGLSLVGYEVTYEWLVMPDDERAERQRHKYEETEREDGTVIWGENGLSYRVRVGYRELLEQFEQETGVKPGSSYGGRFDIYNLCLLPDGTYQAVIRFAAAESTAEGNRYVEDHIIEITCDGRYYVSAREIQQKLVAADKLNLLPLPYEAALFTSKDTGETVGYSYHYRCFTQGEWRDTNHEMPEEILVEIRRYGDGDEALAESLTRYPMKAYPVDIQEQAEELAGAGLRQVAQYGISLDEGRW